MMEAIRQAVAEDTAMKAAGLGLVDGSVVTVNVPIYHGGIGGFQIGDTLLAPNVTGYLRPQTCSIQSGVRVPWLEQKASYDPNMVYATRDLALARDHAAGYGNWSALTRATDVLPRYGSVYEVRPLNAPLLLDFPVNGCCCRQPHGFYEPCMFKSRRFTVIRVVERDIRAVWNSDWRLRLKNLEASYHAWRDMKGGDWYERNSVR